MLRTDEPLVIQEISHDSIGFYEIGYDAPSYYFKRLD
jgi:hypothetical protein